MKRIHIALFLVIIFGCLITYYPHIEYAYPLHVDEWRHISYAKDLIKNSEFPTRDPFTRKFEIGEDMEAGYHIVLGEIGIIEGAALIDPGGLAVFFFIVSALSIFVFARRWGDGVGVLSVLFLSLIPTNVTFLGPAFLAPVNLGFIFIPIGLFLAFRLIKDHENRWAYCFMMSIILLFLLLAHPPTALALLVVLLVFSTLMFRENKGEILSLVLSLVLAIVVSLPHFYPMLVESGLSELQWGRRPWFPETSDPYSLFGLPQTILFIVGFFYMCMKRGKEYLVVPISILVIHMNLIFYVMGGISFLFPFERAYLYLMLLMSVISAYGLVRIKDLALKLSGSQKKALLVTSVLLFTVVALSLQSINETEYYHIVEGGDYEAFLWIGENSDDGEIVLTDPWKAKALVPISERRVVSIKALGPDDRYERLNREIYSFFIRKCKNSDFLVEHNVSMVYAPVKCENKKLIEIRNGVYRFKE